MTEESRLQQFWLRCLLAVGIIWGIIPLITLLFITRGHADSTLDVWAAVLNGLTIFPASMLAFWHRRPACVWLTVNAGLIFTSMTLFVFRTHEYRVGSIIGAGVSVLLAVLLDVAEARRWPGALDSDESGQQTHHP
jgi:hypothetical protein